MRGNKPKRGDKVKHSDTEDESLPFIQGIGHIQYTERPKDDKPKKKRQIGFIRNEKKRTD